VRDFGPNGTLREVESGLDRIRKLGIDAIWLMPIHPTGVKKRKGPLGSPYAVRDFRAIDPALGTDADLRSLVWAAHRRGMKIMLDLVPNHCAADHPYLRRHPEWIRRDARGRPQHPHPEWNDVYALNYDHAGLRREMESIIRYWIERFGIDGFRVDAADRVPNDFWKQTIRRLRRDYPNLILMAEAESAWWQTLGFDLSYDGDLRTAMWRAFCEGQSAGLIGAHLRQRAGKHQDDRHFLRFTENHDIGRTRDIFKPPADRAAAALIFALPGVPLLYAGQEAGFTERPDFFTRRPLPWARAMPGVGAFYRRLIRLRQRHPSLMRGRMTVLDNSQPDEVVSFLRWTRAETLLVAVNIRNRRLRVNIMLPGGKACRLNMPPYAARVQVCAP